MSAKNVLQKHWNGSEWVELHPITKASNVIMDDETSVQQKVMSHMADYTLQIPFATTAGSANTYTVSTNPTLPNLVAGVAIAIKIHAQNTGASTLNWNGKGAKSIKKVNGNDVASGNLRLNGVYTLRYDGVNFILQGEGGEYGTAVASDVLAGKTIGTESGLIVGTMPERGVVTFTPSNVDRTISEGHYAVGSKVNKVSFDASKLLAGTTVADTAGTMLNRSTGDYACDGSSVSGTTLKFSIPDNAYYGDGANITKTDANFVAENIRYGINVLGRVGTCMPVPYRYGIGQELWVPGYSYGGGIQTKQATYLQLKFNSEPKASNSEKTWVTDQLCDLTNVSEIMVEWEQALIYNDYDFSLIASTVKMGSLDTYDARYIVSRKQTDGKERIQLDVSNLTGAFYVRLHIKATDQFGAVTRDAHIYRVILV